MAGQLDMFLKVDGIDGESTDDKHKGWIEVLCFSTGLSQATVGSRSEGGAASAGRVQHMPFKVTKRHDKATPKLLLSCCKGDHIKSIKLELCRATGDKSKYMEYLLTDVLVTSVTDLNTQTEGGATFPTEEVAFNYGKIEWLYTSFNEAGKAAGDVKAHWDLKLNKGG